MVILRLSDPKQPPKTVAKKAGMEQIRQTLLEA